MAAAQRRRRRYTTRRTRSASRRKRSSNGSGFAFLFGAAVVFGILMLPYNLTKNATHGNEAAAVFVETFSFVAIGVLIVGGVVVFKQRQQERYVQSGLPE